MSIVVTGVGAVTALGADAGTTFERILAGECGFGELSLFDPGETRTRIVAEVSSLPSLLASASASYEASRTSELALTAAREAIADAGLEVDLASARGRGRSGGGARRIGLVLGGTTAGMFETESVLADLASSEAARDAAAREGALSKMLSHPLSAPTDRLVRELGPFTRTRSLSSACSSGANALAVGAGWLELGLVDAVLCGGADSLCRVTFSGFQALQALDPDGARPFDARRRGLTLGEGAGFVVLERGAEVRDKRVLCTLLGWAASSEAHHVTNPAPSGEAPLRAIRGALARAGLETSSVDYVNAHGTGTPLNDAMEGGVLMRLFGADVGRVPVSSQKGMIGHTLAAAGALEAVITALAIERSVVPPTGRLEEPDPKYALRHVRKAESRSIRAAITSSFGFGGMDTALVLGRADAPGSSPVASRTAPKRGIVITGVSAITPAGVFVGDEVACLPDVAGEANTAALPDDALEPERARRLDRASRIATVACERALGESASASPGGGEGEVGVVLGIAFGSVDATAEYMRRLRDKGPRLVRPADFPSLVPSSPAGQVSIYLGLTGPALVVADLAASGECALVQACELIASGMADRVCAAAVEERSAIVEAVLAVAFGHRGGARREGGAAIALAREGSGSSARARAIARLGEIVVSDDEGEALERLPPPSRVPPGRAVVVVSGASSREREAAILNRSAWRDVPRVACVDACGAHEAAGGVAIAVAAARVARREADLALFVGSSRSWSYAGTVWPADSST